MKRMIAWTLSVLCILTALALPAYAGEAAPVTEAVTEAEAVTSAEADTVAPTEGESAVPLDEWMYTLLQAATPEQLQLMEGIVLGSMNALDQLEIRGWDRVRVWVEHNMATVMVAALTVALVAFAVLSALQKRSFARKARLLNANAIEMYNAGQAAAEEAHLACRDYADRAEALCRACAASALETAEAAKAAQGKVLEERERLISELARNAAVNEALCETVHFLLQCSDLSQAKRDEAEAIFRRGREAMKHDANEQQKEA